MISEKQKQIIRTHQASVVINSSAASGKAQPNTTKIPTPTGWKKMGELQVGDYVFDRFGNPTKILNVFPQGKKKIWKVTFADKRVSLCCEEHLWSYTNNGKRLITKTLKQMYEQGVYTLDNRGHKSYRYRVPVLRQAARYNNTEAPIHPYVLGCFLGDGCCLEPSLTISSNDEELVATIAKLCNFEYQKLSSKNYSWKFTKNGKNVKTKDFFDGVEGILCRCGDKYIDEKYEILTEELRLELLRGLMDTDGYSGNGKNSPAFFTTSKRLAEDVARLARGLGFYVSVYISNRTDRKSVEYTVNIFTSNQRTKDIFKLSRKREKCLTWQDKPQHTNHNFVSIVNIEPTEEEVEMTCLEVDNKEHLYLTEDYVVTHNTTTLIERLRFLLDNGADPKKVVAITFTNMAAAEILDRLGNPQGLFVGTVHSFANYCLLSSGISTEEIIQNEDFDALFHMVKENPGCIPQIDHLVLDEAQDSTQLQFDFILDYVKPKNFLLFGDTKQSLYSWAGAEPEVFEGLKNRDGVSVYSLNENYRNGRNILNYARKFAWRAGDEDDSIAMRNFDGQVYEIEHRDETLVNAIKNKKFGDYGEWFVLCRTNAQIDQIASLFDKEEIPYDTFKQSELTRSELNEKMKDNTVKILTVHAAKGLEAPNVYVIGCAPYSTEEACVCYVAATRARDLLVWTKPQKKKKPRLKISNWE